MARGGRWQTGCPALRLRKLDLDLDLGSSPGRFKCLPNLSLLGELKTKVLRAEKIEHQSERKIKPFPSLSVNV